MKVSVFWDMALCTLVASYWCFREPTASIFRYFCTEYGSSTLL